MNAACQPSRDLGQLLSQTPLESLPNRSLGMRHLGATSRKPGMPAFNRWPEPGDRGPAGWHSRATPASSPGRRAGYPGRRARGASSPAEPRESGDLPSCCGLTQPARHLSSRWPLLAFSSCSCRGTCPSVEVTEAPPPPPPGREGN